MIIVTAGILRLVFHWCPHWMLLCTHVRCDLRTATTVLVVVSDFDFVMKRLPPLPSLSLCFRLPFCFFVLSPALSSRQLIFLVLTHQVNKQFSLCVIGFSFCVSFSPPLSSLFLLSCRCFETAGPLQTVFGETFFLFQSLTLLYRHFGSRMKIVSIFRINITNTKSTTWKGSRYWRKTQSMNAGRKIWKAKCWAKSSASRTNPCLCT